MKVLLIVAIAALVACGGSGLSEDELAATLAPLTDAHESLEDWQFQIEAGLNYGDTLSGWPEVSADVRGNLGVESLAELDDEFCDASLYLIGLASLHDQWSEVVDAIRSYIADDEDEALIAAKYQQIDSISSRANELKANALRPGQDGACSDDDGD